MESIALINGRVVDGTGRPALAPATILTEGPVFAAVGQAGDIALPRDCRVVDLDGRTVLPGLIDGHMHVTGMPGLLDGTARLRGQLEASELLRECLHRGTTTVGHASGCDENLVLRDMIDTGALKGRARLVVSGVVTATGGHVRGDGADGPWEVRRLARRMALAGVDFYKTCATGGFQWSHEALGRPDYSPEELQALVAEARLRDRLVHVHAHAQPGLQNAIEASPGALPIDLGIDRDGDRVVFRVADRGVGIEAELARRVGEPFLSTKGEHGLGLGLFAASRLAELLGGTFTLEPREGGGAVAVFAVPIEPFEAPRR